VEEKDTSQLIVMLQREKRPTKEIYEIKKKEKERKSP